MDDPFVLLIGLGARTGGVLGIGGLLGYLESNWSPMVGWNCGGVARRSPWGWVCSLLAPSLQRPCLVTPYISLLSWAFLPERGQWSASLGRWTALGFAFPFRGATGFCFHLLARHL